MHILRYTMWADWSLTITNTCPVSLRVYYHKLLKSKVSMTLIVTNGTPMSEKSTKHGSVISISLSYDIYKFIKNTQPPLELAKLSIQFGW